MVRMILFACVLGFCLWQPLHAQSDTVRLTLKEAEQLFLNNNRQLLAARFNILAARGAVTQAGLWNNPTLGFEQNIYNQYTEKWFDMSQAGNTGVQIQQLLLLAGKRGKQARVAEINAGMAELDFRDILRALKLQLITSLYDLYFLRRSLAFYDESIAMLTRTVNQMEDVYRQRAVLLSELLRVKALLFSLRNEQLGIRGKITTAEGNLRILLRDSTGATYNYVPLLDLAGLEAIRLDSLRVSDAIAIAVENRPDLNRTSANLQLEDANLALQKALAVPDLTVGGLWSRAGGYVPNYYALTVSVDLPLFNRNQGNIEMSEHALNAKSLLVENHRTMVAQEVTAAYRKALESDILYKSYDRRFQADYRSLVDGMIANYQKRYITVIEFTDFIESYRTSMVQMNQLENDRADAIATLDFAMGTTLFNP